MKNFGDIKNIRMFAEPYITQSGRTHRNLSGIFYALIIIFGFVPPCGALMRPLLCECKVTGKAEPIFIFCPQRTSIMSIPDSRKECSNGITTPHKTRTPTKRGLTKAQLTEQLNQYTHRYRIERNAKNQAYAYIISEGKLCGFADFCRKYPEADWHAACLTGLLIGMSDT